VDHQGLRQVKRSSYIRRQNETNCISAGTAKYSRSNVNFACVLEACGENSLRYGTKEGTVVTWWDGEA